MKNIDSKKLLTVVQPLPQEEAKVAFSKWKQDNYEFAENLKPEDIITDV
jgi:hypothetical protein